MCSLSQRTASFFLPLSWWHLMLFWLLPVIQAKQQPKVAPSGLILSHLILAAETGWGYRLYLGKGAWRPRGEIMFHFYQAENWVMGPHNTKVICAEVFLNYFHLESHLLLSLFWAAWPASFPKFLQPPPPCQASMTCSSSNSSSFVPFLYSVGRRSVFLELPASPLRAFWAWHHEARPAVHERIVSWE